MPCNCVTLRVFRALKNPGSCWTPSATLRGGQDSLLHCTLELFWLDCPAPFLKSETRFLFLPYVKPFPGPLPWIKSPFLSKAYRASHVTETTCQPSTLPLHASFVHPNCMSFRAHTYDCKLLFYLKKKNLSAFGFPFHRSCSLRNMHIFLS